MSDTARDEAATAQAAGGSPPKETVCCSFCLKSQHEVKRLISGSVGIFICSECVGFCNQVIANRPIHPLKLSAGNAPTERLLERLVAIEDTVQGKGNQLQSMVEILRFRKVSWEQIGAALGISRQSAWERFT